jgi:hypothetical protein
MFLLETLLSFWKNTGLYFGKGDKSKLENIRLGMQNSWWAGRYGNYIL